MDFEEVIVARKSIRTYSNKPVNKEIIIKCLEAARAALPGRTSSVGIS
jgi:nitroreductase